MAQCSFCGKELPHGTGTMYIKKDAKVLWFCSNKCEKNMLALRRKPRNRAWTAESKAAKEAAKAAAEHKEGVKAPASKAKKSERGGAE